MTDPTPPASAPQPQADDLGPRPQTTCMFKLTKSSRRRACCECGAVIESGESYWHDQYYSTYGSGARRCRACGDRCIEAEHAWEGRFAARQPKGGERG